MTNVFISWSGDQSREIAEELRVWIPSVLQFAKPYFTPNDIEKGAKWGQEISKKLAESHVGIICLTKDNLSRPWILFEAGALSKDMEKSRVCSVLFGMEDTDLSGPLTTFQTTKFLKADFKKLMLSINESAGSSALARETFDRVFEMWWPNLETKVGEILQKAPPEKEENIREDRELLEEILLLTRSYSRLARRETRFDLPAGLSEDLVSSIEVIMLQNEQAMDHAINDACGVLLKIAGFLAKRTEKLDAEIENRILKLSTKQDDFIPF